jgi:hypothetical protein
LIDHIFVSPEVVVQDVFAPYDPAMRFEVVVQPAEPQRLEVPTATDGVVPFARIGRLALMGPWSEPKTIVAGMDFSKPPPVRT